MRHKLEQKSHSRQIKIDNELSQHSLILRLTAHIAQILRKVQYGDQLLVFLHAPYFKEINLNAHLIIGRAQFMTNDMAQDEACDEKHSYSNIKKFLWN